MTQERVEGGPAIFLELTRIERRLANMEERLIHVEGQELPFDRSKIYQHLSVPARSNGIVYDYSFTGYLAHIYYIGCRWYPNTHIDWLVDNVLRERVLHTYGNAAHPANEPMHLDPPLTAKHSIRFIAYNDDAALNPDGTYVHPSRVFEVFCDGTLRREN